MPLFAQNVKEAAPCFQQFRQERPHNPSFSFSLKRVFCQGPVLSFFLGYPCALFFKFKKSFEFHPKTFRLCFQSFCLTMTPNKAFRGCPHRANFVRFRAISARCVPVSMEEAPAHKQRSVPYVRPKQCAGFHALLRLSQRNADQRH